MIVDGMERPVRKTKETADRMKIFLLIFGSVSNCLKPFTNSFERYFIINGTKGITKPRHISILFIESMPVLNGVNGSTIRHSEITQEIIYKTSFGFLSL